jgi:hypothetical protein
MEPDRLHFCFAVEFSRMTPNEDIWQKIIAEAMDKASQVSRGPVAGAKLREIVATVARKHGEEYPPAENRGQKFGDFLRGFGSLVVVLRREGRDFLVAPADKPELLAGEQDDKRAYIRDDVFEAFTRLPHEVPPLEAWYRRDSDTFRWIPQGENVDATELVKVPLRTEPEEVEDRKAFAMLPQFERIQELLLATLSDHAALWAFSRAIKERGLGRQWHVFRLQSIIKRIRSWCESQHVEWRDEWLTPKTIAAAPKTLASVQRMEFDQKARFGRLLERLTDEDLKRIVLPLDLVLKILQ